MRSLSALMAVCLMALVMGCSQEIVYHDVNYDYDVTADFSRMKTYQWVSMPATLRIDEFNRSRIREYTDIELETRGLAVTEDNPDMYIVMFGGGYKAVDMSKMMQYEVYTIGRLKLAMYESASNREIWWGETKADLHLDMSPEQKDEVTKSAVTRILMYYPPSHNLE